MVKAKDGKEGQGKRVGLNVSKEEVSVVFKRKTRHEKEIRRQRGGKTAHMPKCRLTSIQCTGERQSSGRLAEEQTRDANTRKHHREA